MFPSFERFEWFGLLSGLPSFGFFQPSSCQILLQEFLFIRDRLFSPAIELSFFPSQSSSHRFLRPISPIAPAPIPRIPPSASTRRTATHLSAFHYFPARAPSSLDLDQSAAFDSSAPLSQLFQLLDMARDDLGWHAQINQQMLFDLIDGLHRTPSTSARIRSGFGCWQAWAAVHGSVTTPARAAPVGPAIPTRRQAHAPAWVATSH
jgi:hypothetical protein